MRENKSGSGRSFGKSRFGSDQKQLYKATCANCGNTCEVPFKPNGSKPVLCKDCFQGSAQEGRGRSESRSFGRGRSDDRQMYEAVCSSCGDTCQIPFRPSPGRDVFCSRCFEKNEGGESRSGEHKSFDKPRFSRDDNRHSTPNYSAQFEALNAKMDKILSLLAPTVVDTTPLESAIDEEVIEEILEEVQDEQPETAVEKPKKAKAAAKSKTKKKASPKKK